MSQKTPLYLQHCQLGGLMVDFAGWLMPLNYGSQIAEHHNVRQNLGIFDVSHMGIVEVQGVESQSFLRFALANDIAKLDVDGKALYSCLLNPDGGIIDDLIVYRMATHHYRLVINAGRRAVDLDWLKELAAHYQVEFTERTDLAMVAVQGPRAITAVQQVLPQCSGQIAALKPFHLLMNNHWQIARTGYTGEDGVEVILPGAEVGFFWQSLLNAGAKPAGLGARDTLRLEAGLNLYGSDMNEQTHPLESNLALTVSWQDSTRKFMGYDALLKLKSQGIGRRLVGLVMEQAGVLRNHQRVWMHNQDVGEITSGSFSPTLGYAIAMARIPAGIETSAMVERRGMMIPVEIIKLPFVRFGKKAYELASISEG